MVDKISYGIVVVETEPWLLVETDVIMGGLAPIAAAFEIVLESLLADESSGVLVDDS